MEPSHYEEVPRNVAEEFMNQIFAIEPTLVTYTASSWISSLSETQPLQTWWANGGNADEEGCGILFEISLEEAAEIEKEMTSLRAEGNNYNFGRINLSIEPDLQTFTIENIGSKGGGNSFRIIYEDRAITFVHDRQLWMT